MSNPSSSLATKFRGMSRPAERGGGTPPWGETRLTPRGRVMAALAVGLALLAVLPVSPASSEGGAFGRAGAFAPREEDPRGVALGGASVTLTEGGGTIFANPAALATVPATRLDAMYCNPFGLSFLRERYLALSWRRTEEVWLVEDDDIRRRVTISRAGFGAAIHTTSIDFDPEDYTEMAISLSYGAQRWHDVAWGITVRYLRANSDLDEVTGSGYGLDAALLWTHTSGLRLGARFENAVANFSWDFGGDESPAQRLELGGARPLGGRVLLAGQLTFGNEQTTLQALGLGLEYVLVEEVLTLRAGLRQSDHGSRWENSPRAGIGLRWRKLTLDYSVSDEGSFLAETHRLAIGLSL